MDANSVQETAENLADYINHLMHADSVLLVRLDNQMRYKEVGSWKAERRGYRCGGGHETVASAAG